MSDKKHPIMCHITDSQGIFHSISCVLTAPYTAGSLRHNPKLSPYFTPSHRIFIAPSVRAQEETSLLGYEEVFILGQAHISPTEWRHRRLASSRK